MKTSHSSDRRCTLTDVYVDKTETALAETVNVTLQALDAMSL